MLDDLYYTASHIISFVIYKTSLNKPAWHNEEMQFLTTFFLDPGGAPWIKWKVSFYC